MLSYVIPSAQKSLFLSSSSDQVLDWIENHGEAFLSKHTGVGKSLHRARALQKRHDDFEEVAQVRCWVCVLGVGGAGERTRAAVWCLMGHVRLITHGFWAACLPNARRLLSALVSLGEW